MVLGVALAASPLGGADHAAPALVPLAVLSLVALAVSLLWTPLPGLVLAGLAVELVVRELDAHVSTGQIVGYGVGLLLLCELIAWADTLRSPGRVAPGVVARRAGSLAVAVVVGVVAATLTVAGGSIESPNAFVAGVAGAAAVAALVAVVWALGRNPA